MKNYILKNINKIMQKIRLPNAAAVEIIILRENEISKLYGINKKYRSITTEKFPMLTKANKYMQRQMQRLIRHHVNGEQERFAALLSIILAKSWTFRIKALNHVKKEWFLWPKAKLNHYLRGMHKIGITQSTDFKYKRQWIDKKPNDAARPLGIPQVEWRAHLHNLNSILEAAFSSGGKLRTWQHGGRSGRGTATALSATMDILRKYKFVYEFDIKGFFDNIDQTKVKDTLVRELGEPLGNWITKLLETKPTEYILPEIEKDIAYQTNEQYQALKESLIDDIGELMEVHPGETDIWDDEEIMDMLDMMFSVVKMDQETQGDLVNRLLDDLIDFMGDEIPQLGKYKAAMNQEEMSIGDQLDSERFTQEEREQGRDHWKGLGVEGKGLPQGSPISPFLATLMTDVHFRGLEGNILMYMDDGLIYGNTRAEVEGKIKLLEETLKKLGLELAPDKCGYVKEEAEGKLFKFLGIRTDGQRMFQATREGNMTDRISVPHKIDPDKPSKESRITWLQRLIDYELQRRQKGWEERVERLRTKIREILFENTSSTIQAAQDYDFFSSLLSKLYSPDQLGEIAEMQVIKDGKKKVWNKILGSSRTSVFKRMARNRLRLPRGMRPEATLTTASSLSCIQVLNDIKSMRFSARLASI